MKLWHDAELENSGSNQSVTRMMSNPKSNSHELVAEITDFGQWTISLYAQFTEESGKNWAAVLRHLVTAEPCQL